jgi:hypothetical protein
MELDSSLLADESLMEGLNYFMRCPRLHRRTISCDG